MSRKKTTISYLYPSFIGLGIMIIDIFVSSKLHNSYFSAHNSCGARPSPVITIIIALIGLSVSVYGIINTFKRHSKLFGAIAIILSLIAGFLGLIALFVLVFKLCW